MENKKWWKSKTIWGSILMFMAFGLSFFGVTITPEEQAGAVEFIVMAAIGLEGVIGFILVIIGRFKATKRIG